MLYLLILNNYLHDLATGMFFASTILGYYLSREICNKDSETDRKAIRILRRLAKVSFVAIFPFGLIRLAFFAKIELNPYRSVDMTNVLIFKHIILFILTFSGVLLWVKLPKEKR